MPTKKRGTEKSENLSPEGNRGLTSAVDTGVFSQKNSKSSTRKDPRGKGLTPWKPGQSGNPKGRPPKGETVAEVWRAFLEGKDDPDDKMTRREKLMQAMYRKGLSGDVAAVKLVLERTDGLPIQRMQIDSGISALTLEDLKKRTEDVEREGTA